MSFRKPRFYTIGRTLPASGSKVMTGLDSVPACLGISRKREFSMIDE